MFTREQSFTASRTVLALYAFHVRRIPVPLAGALAIHDAVRHDYLSPLWFVSANLSVLFTADVRCHLTLQKGLSLPKCCSCLSRTRKTNAASLAWASTSWNGSHRNRRKVQVVLNAFGLVQTRYCFEHVHTLCRPNASTNRERGSSLLEIPVCNLQRLDATRPIHVYNLFAVFDSDIVGNARCRIVG